MALDKKYEVSHKSLLRDSRPLLTRIADWSSQSNNSFAVLFLLAVGFHLSPAALQWADVFLIAGLLYAWWLSCRDRSLVFRLPLGTKYKDKKGTKPEGILYLGNQDVYKDEVWFSNSDARTHILYLGTTGSGKTEGLKAMASNALCWASGFV
jgi:intracellular multiplication protein IcmO